MQWFWLALSIALVVIVSMGQMIDDIRLAEECIRPVYLCNRAGGMIPSPEQVLASIQRIAGGN